MVHHRQKAEVGPQAPDRRAKQDFKQRVDPGKMVPVTPLLLRAVASPEVTNPLRARRASLAHVRVENPLQEKLPAAINARIEGATITVARQRVTRQRLVHLSRVQPGGARLGWVPANLPLPRREATAPRFRVLMARPVATMANAITSRSPRPCQPQRLLRLQHQRANRMA